MHTVRNNTIPDVFIPAHCWAIPRELTLTTMCLHTVSVMTSLFSLNEKCTLKSVLCREISRLVPLAANKCACVQFQKFISSQTCSLLTLLIMLPIHSNVSHRVPEDSDFSLWQTVVCVWAHSYSYDISEIFIEVHTAEPFQECLLLRQNACTQLELWHPRVDKFCTSVSMGKLLTTQDITHVTPGMAFILKL